VVVPPLERTEFARSHSIFTKQLFAQGNGLLNSAIPPSVVILSVAEGSAFHGREKQIPPLRCAPVGMTVFCGVASASVGGRYQHIKADAMNFVSRNLFRIVVRLRGNDGANRNSLYGSLH
jgi:hypothetical protein